LRHQSRADISDSELLSLKNKVTLLESDLHRAEQRIDQAKARKQDEDAVQTQSEV
jgi:hypothetical protein